MTELFFRAHSSDESLTAQLVPVRVTKVVPTVVQITVRFYNPLLHDFLFHHLCQSFNEKKNNKYE